MRGVPEARSCRTAWRTISVSTAGENSAAANPMSSTDAITDAVPSAKPSQQKPAIRSTQPARTTGRAPNRSVSVPPTTNRPCWLKVRRPSTRPTSHPARPSPPPRWSAR
ncbi:hypothetical protein GCM10009551_018590 [Nocardiopsis tropica]